MTRGTLKYNRKTWHYRLMLWAWCYSSWSKDWKTGRYEYRLPDNLCKYLRKLVITVPLSIPLFIWRSTPDIIQDHKDIVRAIIVTTLTIHTIMFLINLALVVEGSEPFPWWMGWAVIVTLWLGFVGLIGLGFGIAKLWEYLRCKRGVKIGKPSTMCLVEDYLEAKHDKICPNIEFVSDKKEDKPDDKV